MAYEDIPEPVRWVLYLPALWFCMVIFGLIMRLVNFLHGPTGAIGELVLSSIMANAFVFLVFALAPRWKPLLGWLLAVPVVCLVGLLTLVSILRGLAIAGVLPIPPSPEWSTWGREDWINLGRGLVWTFFGALSFLHYRQEYTLSPPPSR